LAHPRDRSVRLLSDLHRRRLHRRAGAGRGGRRWRRRLGDRAAAPDRRALLAAEPAGGADPPRAPGGAPAGGPLMSDAWVLAYHGLDPGQEGLREALCTLGNGVFATRGAAEEHDADGVSYPGTYAGGIYNQLASEVAGRVVINEDLVNLPSWLPLAARPADGDWLDPWRLEALDYSQELDMRSGVLLRRFRVRDGAGRITAIESRRLVSIDRP